MKLLSGSELTGFIKERQAKQVRALRQAHHVAPKLAIVQTLSSPVIDTYVRLKQHYGDDILIDVETRTVTDEEIISTIETLNSDPSVHGIIVQLPLGDPTKTDDVVSRIDPKKDVDALASTAHFDAATPMAINWLLTGYGIELNHKSIVIVGHGRLVGAPLATMWQHSGLKPVIVSEPSENLSDIVREADIVVTATGTPGLITSDMLRPGAVVVDAGTSSEDGQIKGDVAPEVRDRSDITITPEKGGVGPLTVAALFDNVIRAARASVPTSSDS